MMHSTLVPLVVLLHLLSPCSALSLSRHVQSDRHTQTAGMSTASDISFVQPYYAYITTSKGQSLKGGVVAKGKEGSMVVRELKHGITHPHDHSSGLATGRRQHKPMFLQIEMDKATPLLLNALIDGDRDGGATLDVKIDQYSNGPVKTWTTKLAGAKILSIEMNTPGMIDVEFVYKKIEWTYLDGNVAAQDDWAV